MNLYHLRYFVTLAHMEHYTRAADLLAITQPSLSHAISSLESELGVKLFTECHPYQIRKILSHRCRGYSAEAGFFRRQFTACR